MENAKAKAENAISPTVGSFLLSLASLKSSKNKNHQEKMTFKAICWKTKKVF